MSTERNLKTSLPIIKKGKSNPNVKIYIQEDTDALESLDGAINIINLLKSQQA
jgi:hypothetical protein